jgi:lysophospholipase L1-like esterase
MFESNISLPLIPEVAVNARRSLLATVVLFAAFAPAQHPALARDGEADWVEAMRAVHARFKGKPGTLAQFGDSTTETLAYWTPLLYDPKGLSPEMTKARDQVMAYLRKECWREWKGPNFGSEGRRTIDWASENADTWLKKLDPEVVVILFGTNDMREGNARDFERRLTAVARRCLDNGSVVILTTPPPRSGMLEQSKQFADAVRLVAAVLRVPVIDYQAEILKRRPDDWDGSLPQFKEAAKEDAYQAPTLIAGDGVHPSNPSKFGDYTEESLRSNGYSLRNYLTLMKYTELLRSVLKPEKSSRP